jgi:hypothetical protein
MDTFPATHTPYAHTTNKPTPGVLYDITIRALSSTHNVECSVIPALWPVQSCQRSPCFWIMRSHFRSVVVSIPCSCDCTMYIAAYAATSLHGCDRTRSRCVKPTSEYPPKRVRVPELQSNRPGQIWACRMDLQNGPAEWH